MPAPRPTAAGGPPARSADRASAGALAAAPRVRLSGTPEWAGVGGPEAWQPQRRYQLLAVLAVHAGEWVARDHLATLFWPERANDEARRNLRKVIFRARELPGAADLQAGEHALRWDVRTDVTALRDALHDARHADALPLHRGALLAGLDDPTLPDYSDWLAAERQRFDADWRQAALAQLHALDGAEPRRALAARLLALDGFDEEALAALIAAERALGHEAAAQRHYTDYARRLAASLGVEPARALREQMRPAALAGGQPSADTPLATGAASAVAADADTGFVGRRLELAEIVQRLQVDGERLLNVHGPGGIGKSRLARAALARLAPQRSGRAWWIELQDLSDNDGVVARLAQCLGLELAAGQDVLQSAQTRLAGGPALLVLDNAEHLAGLAALLRRLLDGCAGLQILLTSRTRLHLADETVLPLAGLALPDDESRDLEAAQAFDAVRLFAQCAQRAQRGFALAPHLREVLGIVDAVAGMPLAIELAAGWVRLLPPAEILRDLEHSIDLLQRDPGSTGTLQRPAHESLRATLDQSWRLLAPRERDALAALSVFHGGFTRATAQAVAEVALPLLSSLADRSLLATDACGRFDLHPMVRAYAAERLAADAAQEARARRAHAEHFARHLAALAPHTQGDQRLLVAGVTAEYANCRGAWLHALQLGDAALAGAMVRTLWSYFENRGRHQEGIALIQPALAMPAQGQAAARAQQRARHGLSMLLHRVGRSQESIDVAAGGIALGEGCGDLEAYVGCILNTGSSLWHLGQADAAHARFDEALAVAQRRGDAHCIAWALGNLGVTHTHLGRWDAAADCLQRALAVDRERGNSYQVGVHLINLSSLRLDQGDLDAVADLASQGLAHSQATDLLSFVMLFRQRLGIACRLLGRPAQARRHFEDALADTAAHGDKFGVTVGALIGLARLDIAEGHAEAALRRLQDGARLALGPSRHYEAGGVLNAWAQWLASGGRSDEAVGVWQQLLAEGDFTAAARQQIEAQLRGLPPRSPTAPAARRMDALLDALLGER